MGDDPELEDVRGWYIEGRRVHNPFASDATLVQPFDRWYAAELAAAERRGAVKALREAADEIDSILYQRRRTLGGTTPDWLNARADRIEEEAKSHE